jgi:hypothetical protein
MNSFVVLLHGVIAVINQCTYSIAASTASTSTVGATKAAGAWSANICIRCCFLRIAAGFCDESTCAGYRRRRRRRRRRMNELVSGDGACVEEGGV